MRLTLRTLLAYLDDLLDPLDAVELGRRIDESKFATDLVQRIRQRAKQPRLGAPKVDGRGIGLDANSVAEYLDNTLASDRVPEFEKVCLESDLHLSEVAACHHILALVLDKPATVSPALRARAHRLISLSTPDFALPTLEPPVAHSWNSPLGAGPDTTADAADYGLGTAGVGFESATGSGPEGRGGTGPGGARLGTSPVDDFFGGVQVPLGEAVSPAVQQTATAAGAVVGSGTKVAAGSAGARKSQKNMVWWGAGLAAILGVLAFGAPRVAQWWSNRGGADLVVAQGDRGSSVAANGGERAAAEGDAAAGVTGQPKAGSAATNQAATKLGATKLGASKLGAPNLPAANVPPADSPAGAKAQGAGEGATGAGATGDGAAGERAAADAGKPVRPGATLSDDEGDVPGERAVGNKLAPADTKSEKMDGVPAAVGGRGAALLGGRPKAAAIPPLASDLLEEPADGAQGMEVARMASENQVLARLNAADERWYRVARGGRILPGERLVSLPVYRPQLVLSSGAQLLLIGEAAVELSAGSDERLGTINLLYGRVLLSGAGHPGLRLQLNLGGCEGQLRLLEADTEVALEVRRSLAPGSDPERDAAWVTVALYARGGQAVWTASGGAEARLAAGFSWQQSLAEPAGGRGKLLPGDVVVEEQAFPKWSDPRVNSKLDHDAAEQLESFLVVERPLTLGLEEKTGFRKTEVRSLVARCLAELGSYDAVLGELASEQQHAYWGVTVESLRQSLARSPETAAKIRETLSRLRQEEGKSLYRMLWDYNPEQLEREGAQQLVDALEYQDLDQRVLAFENLRRITGLTLNYRPEGTPERRRIPTQQWKKRLKDGGIVLKTVP